MKETDLLIKAEELKQLATFIGELPTKFGAPLSNFLQALAQKRELENSEVQTVTAESA